MEITEFCTKVYFRIEVNVKVTKVKEALASVWSCNFILIRNWEGECLPLSKTSPWLISRPFAQ